MALRARTVAGAVQTRIQAIVAIEIRFRGRIFHIVLKYFLEGEI